VRLLHPSPIRPLLASLFDDAALFPPGNAPMPQAVAAHGRHAKSWYADLVGSFICPDGRLAELDTAAQHARFGDVGISVTVPGGGGAVEGARKAAAEFGWLHIKAIEVPCSAAEVADAVPILTSRPGPTMYVEVPVADVTPDVALTLANANLGLKLRTGGTVAEAFPSSAALAGALGAACASGVRFKCTAGLHNAVRHLDPDSGFAHHGFLNVLWAIQRLQDKASEPEALFAGVGGRCGRCGRW
jgi:hypothetical protein